MHLAWSLLQATGGTGGTAQVAIGSALAAAMRVVVSAASAKLNRIFMRKILCAEQAAASAS